MINIFIDTELTHLPDGINPEPPSLISIGCATDTGASFYAENGDVQLEMCSDFVRAHVLPLLEGGDALMKYPEIARQLRGWIEALGRPCQMWSDAPDFDWPPVLHMFDCHGWPHNLMREPADLAFASPLQTQRFEVTVEHTFNSNPSLRRHHALDDAIVNMQAFRYATAQSQ